MAPIIAWRWGGHIERFAVAVQLLSWMVFGSFRWMIGDVYIDSMIEDALSLLIFGWLVFRSNRWWPFVATAALTLTVLVHILTIMTDISWGAAVSARVGQSIILHLALLAGAAERWLAGERAVGAGQVWRRRRSP